MGKAAQVLKLVRKINVGRMFDTAREISQQTGKNRLAVLTDIVWCGMKYSPGLAGICRKHPGGPWPLL